MKVFWLKKKNYKIKLFLGIAYYQQFFFHLFILFYFSLFWFFLFVWIIVLNLILMDILFFSHVLCKILSISILSVMNCFFSMDFILYFIFSKFWSNDRMNLPSIDFCVSSQTPLKTITSFYVLSCLAISLFSVVVFWKIKAITTNDLQNRHEHYSMQ